MRLLLPLLVLPLLLALAALPCAAQDEAVAGTDVDGVLASLWAETLGGATAVTWVLDEAVSATTDSTLAEDARTSDHRRALLTASTAAASTAGGLVAALQFTIALADPAEQEAVEAELAEDAVSLHSLLVWVAEEAGTAALDLPDTALDATPEGYEPEDPDTPETWRERADQIRELGGRLSGATQALGINFSDE